MSQQYVWMSDTLMNPRFLFGFETYDKDLSLDAFIDVLKKSQDRRKPSGVLKSEQFPTKLRLHKTERKKMIYPFFHAAGLWVVTKQLADTFRQFDMGDIAFHPITLYSKDGKPPLDGDFFLD